MTFARAMAEETEEYCTADLEIDDYDPVGPDPDFEDIYGEPYLSEDGFVYEDPEYEPTPEEVLFSSTGGVALLFLGVAISLCIVVHAWWTGGTLAGYDVGDMEFSAMMLVLVLAPVFLAFENVLLALFAGVLAGIYIGQTDPEYYAVVAALVASAAFYILGEPDYRGGIASEHSRCNMLIRNSRYPSDAQ